MRGILIMLGACLLTATLITSVFIIIATNIGSYTPTDIAIGSIWFFVISFIASMPLLIPKLRRRLEA